MVGIRMMAGLIATCIGGPAQAAPGPTLACSRDGVASALMLDFDQSLATWSVNVDGGSKVESKLALARTESGFELRTPSSTGIYTRTTSEIVWSYDGRPYSKMRCIERP